MEKKRRYEILTNVRIPDMEEIRLAAADFAEPAETAEQKPGSKSQAYATQRVRRVPKYADQLSSIKNEMEQLANKVAIEEEEKEAEEAAEAIVAADAESESSDETRADLVTDADADEKREASDPLLESVAAAVKTTMDKKRTEAPKKPRNKSKQ
jgi:hypothetical protein